MRLLAVLLALSIELSGGESPAIPVAPYSFKPAWLPLAAPAPSGKGQDPTFGRLAAGTIVPIFDPGRIEVSDDGWWLAINGNLLVDLRRRAVVWWHDWPSGAFAAFDDRHLLRSEGAVSLETGSFIPYRQPDGGYMPFVIPGAGPRWGVPGQPAELARGSFAWTHRIANSPWSWATCFPEAQDALNPAPRHHHAWIVDHANRRIIAGLRTTTASTRLDHWIETRLVLGLQVQPGLPAPLQQALSTCGSLRNRTQDILDGRLHAYRLAGDAIAPHPVPGAPAGITAASWSPAGSAVCTTHDGVVQTWTADWAPIARLPLLKRSYPDTRPAGPGRYSITLDRAPFLVDCLTLRCAPHNQAPPPSERPATGTSRPHVGPDGVVARCGKRLVPIIPATVDWRQVRWTWQADDLSVAAALDAAGSLWVTQLPDGQPFRVSGSLPKPPFTCIPIPGGDRLLAVTTSDITHIDLITAAAVRRVPITGEVLYARIIMQETPGPTIHGTIDGVAWEHAQAPFLRPCFSIADWPTAISDSGTLAFNLESGLIARRDPKMEFSAVADLAEWRIDSLGPPLADGRRIVSLRRAGIAHSVRAVVDPSGKRPTDIMPVPVAMAASGDLHHLGDRVWHAADSQGGHRVWNSATGGWAVLYPQPDGSVVAWSDDGYIAVPRRYADALSIGVGGLGVRCSAFDLQINRPDKVLERIGLADPAYLALLREAWERRVRKLGLDPAKVAKPARYQDVPRLRLTAVPPGRTDAARIELACEVRTRTSVPLTVAVRVGGLAVGALPLAASGEVGAPVKLSVPVDLHVGLNRIEVVPVLADGSSGVPAMAVVQRSGPVPRTRIAAIGVSTYREPGRDLGYAAADARSLAEVFAAGDDCLVLTDREVVRATVARIRSHLAAAQPGDLAVVSVAAHGLVGADGVYRIATHDTDFAAPQAQGIAIEELLDALRASPARRRLLLLDTCHAGEQDGAQPTTLVEALPDGRARGLRAKTADPAPLPKTGQPAPVVPTAQPVRPIPAVIARTMFLGSGWEDGVTVLAACRGDEASWESPTWGHGAFSQAIIQALGQARKRADSDGDGAIDLGELGSFVMAEVPRMTGDQQHPEIRAGELDRDIVLLPAR
jgi:hypothetical protein